MAVAVTGIPDTPFRGLLKPAVVSALTLTDHDTYVADRKDYFLSLTDDQINTQASALIKKASNYIDDCDDSGECYSAFVSIDKT